MSDLKPYPAVPVDLPAASSTRPAPSHRTRWLVALLTTLTMLLGSVGVAVFAADGAAAAGAGPVYLPASSVLYAEARLDLPGDQRTQVMSFLAHIPGFEDPSTFDIKLDGAIDSMLASGGMGLSYSNDIKPWSNGLISVGLPSLPAQATDMSGADVILGLGVADRAALDTALPAIVTAAGTGATVATTDYNGTTITTFTPADGSAGKSIAPTDSYLLIASQPSTIESSLDILAGSTPSLAQDPGFSTAWAGLPSDRLAAFYADGTQLRTALKAQMSSGGTSASTAMVADGLLGLIPDHFVGALRADADHVTALLQAQPNASAPPMAVRSTDLAAHMPASALAYVEIRDLGGIIDGLLGQVVTGMSSSANPEALARIDGILGNIGTSFGTFFDFAQDGAVMVADDGTTLSVGVVATLTDEAAGSKRLDVLLALLGFVSGGADAPVAATTEDVNGTTVTTITINPSAGILPEGLPFTPAISVAIADGHLYVGLGDFAKTALTQDPSTSLTSNQRFAAAQAAVGSSNGGMVWVDIAGLAPIIEATMDAASRTDYDANTKPYVDHIDYLVAALNQANGLSSAQAQLYVK